MIDLGNHCTRCEPHAKIIVSRDKRQPREHRAMNVDRDAVRQYLVDGDIIPDQVQSKCDFMLLNDTKYNAYLIELKGTDFSHSIEQLKNSARLLADILYDYVVHYRIVYRANTHAVRGSTFSKFRDAVTKINKCSSVVAKTDYLEEVI